MQEYGPCTEATLFDEKGEIIAKETKCRYFGIWVLKDDKSNTTYKVYAILKCLKQKSI